MTDVKSIRFSKEVLARIRKRAKRENLDESTTIRQLVALGLQDYACDLYQDGKVTLREAADLADLAPRDMIDLLHKRGIRGNVTLQQQQQAVRHAIEATQKEK